MAAMGMIVVPGALPTHLPGLLGPAFGAIAASLVTGRNDLRRLVAGVLRLRMSWLGWLAALSPAALILALAVVPGWVSLDGLGRYPGLPALGLPAVFLLALVMNGFGEETGWRGWLQPSLQQRFGPWRGLFVLFGLWALWHAPLFLVVESFRGMGLPLLLGGWLPGLFAGTLVLANVRGLAGGSILAVALWHTLYNFTSATEAGSLLPAVSTTLVIAWAVVIAVRRHAHDISV